MISAQSFFSFSEDRDLPVIPLSNVTLSDNYPIYFGITWHTVVPKVAKSQFFSQHVCADACFHYLAYPLCLEFGATSAFSDRMDSMVV